MKTAADVELYVDDPILAPIKAAEYLGIEPRTLREVAALYSVERSPMPGKGTIKWGYRRSALNKLLRQLEVKFSAYRPGAGIAMSQTVHSSE